MKFHHTTQRRARIWPTVQQIRKLIELGLPEAEVKQMNYREADRILTTNEKLPAYVLEHELRFELPPIRAVSVAQNLFARHARFHYLNQVPEVYEGISNLREQALFMQALQRIKAATAAQYWIDKKRARLAEDFAHYLASSALGPPSTGHTAKSLNQAAS